MRLLVDRLLWMVVITSIAGVIYIITAMDKETHAACREAQVDGTHPKLCTTCKTGVPTLPAIVRLHDMRYAESLRRSKPPLPLP